jgi:hypothetical protein
MRVANQIAWLRPRLDHGTAQLVRPRTSMATRFVGQRDGPDIGAQFGRQLARIEIIITVGAPEHILSWLCVDLRVPEDFLDQRPPALDLRHKYPA